MTSETAIPREVLFVTLFVLRKLNKAAQSEIPNPSGNRKGATVGNRKKAVMKSPSRTRVRVVCVWCGRAVFLLQPCGFHLGFCCCFTGFVAVCWFLLVSAGFS